MDPTLSLPNFLIVGAMKAGTSSLADLMNAHEDIFVADRELHFFNNEREYAKGLKHYSHHFAGSEAHWRGEKTPVYSRIHDMEFLPARIHESLGKDLRLFWILRDPVDRAISHYRHMLVTQSNPDRKAILRPNGRIWTFHEVIERELSNPQEAIIVPRGYYAQQLESYSTFFDKRNFFICRFSEMLEYPQQVMDNIANFLSIDRLIVNTAPNENSSLIRANKGFRQKVVERLGNGTLPSPHALLRYLNRIRQRKEVSERFSEIDQAAIATLREHYKSHQSKLESMVDWENGSLIDVR